MTAIDSPEGRAMLERLIATEAAKLEERRRGRRAGELLRALVASLPRCEHWPPRENVRITPDGPEFYGEDSDQQCVEPATKRTCGANSDREVWIDYACDEHADYADDWHECDWAEAVRRAKEAGMV